MLLQIDTEVESEAGLRAALILLSTIVGMKYGSDAESTSTIVPPPPFAGPITTHVGEGSQPQNLPREVPPPPHDTRDNAFRGHSDSTPSNVVPFVPPPPPLSEAPALSSSNSNSTLPTLTQPSSSEPLVYDAAGLPWDARIHQKKQSKKKDGTWKLQKGIDPAVVMAVVAELASKRLPASVTQSSAPPTASGRVPAPPVSVEATSVKINGQPLPPIEGQSVPPPPPPEFGTGSPAASVPLPPLSDPNASASEFKALLDKITAASQAKQITPQKVNEIVQSQGAPSLMALKGMPQLVPAVTQAIDLAIMGIG